jgi:hypothetical protein
MAARKKTEDNLVLESQEEVAKKVVKEQEQKYVEGDIKYRCDFKSYEEYNKYKGAKA